MVNQNVLDEFNMMMCKALSDARSISNIKDAVSRINMIDWDAKIYRTISFSTFVRLITTGGTLFKRPKVWKDSYENFWLRHVFVDDNGEGVSCTGMADHFYAQCWSKDRDSVAMWRTASQDPQYELTVRIESTVGKYCEALVSAINTAYHIQLHDILCVGRVKYVSEDNITTQMERRHSSKKEDMYFLRGAVVEDGIKALFASEVHLALNRKFVL